MNKKILIMISSLIGVGIIVLLSMSIVDIAVGSVLILLLFIGTYSYVMKDNEIIPEDPHTNFKEELEEEFKKENSFLEKTKTCHVCNTENNINRKYCKKCQTLIQNITCPVCNTVNPHTAKYCKSCDSILQNKTRA